MQILSTEIYHLEIRTVQRGTFPSFALFSLIHNCYTDDTKMLINYLSSNQNDYANTPRDYDI